MKRLLLVMLALGPLAWGQSGRPTCQVTYRISNRAQDVADGVTISALSGGAGTTLPFNNKQCGAAAWIFSYATEGLSAISIQLEDSQNLRGPNGSDNPSSFAAWQGTVIDGSNPSTALSAYYSAKGYYPWLRVNITSSTGTGSVDIILSGYISPSLVSSGGAATGGSVGGATNLTTAADVPFVLSAGILTQDNNFNYVTGTSTFNSPIINSSTSYKLQSSAVLVPNGAQLQIGTGFSSIQTPTVTTYNGISTIGTGHPAEYATVDAVAQSAAITATTLYTPTVTALFRVSYYAKVTTPGTSSILGGTTGLVLAFTDGTDSVAQTAYTLPEDNQLGAALSVGTGNTTNTTQAALTGTAVIFAKTGVAITYAFGYSSTGTAMQYELHIKLEQM